MIYIKMLIRRIYCALRDATLTSSRTVTRTVHSAARVTENPWPCSCDCLCSQSPLNSDGSHSQALTHSIPARVHRTREDSCHVTLCGSALASIS